MFTRRLFIGCVSMALVIPIPISSIMEVNPTIPVFISPTERRNIARSFALNDFISLGDDSISICGWILTRSEASAIYIQQYSA